LACLNLWELRLAVDWQIAHLHKHHLIARVMFLQICLILKMCNSQEEAEQVKARIEVQVKEAITCFL